MIQHQNIFKSITYIFFIFFLGVELFAQARFENKISGKVINAETGKPLSNVNVFLANTTRGDATGTEGYYLIENIPPGAYDLVFSMIGFELKIVPVQFVGLKTIKFNMKLRPQILEGETISIEAREPKEWRKNLERFIKEFIGETENARKCKILNPEVLDFKIEKPGKKFIATTDSILVVENRSLGYRLHIILDTFRISKDSLIYATYPRYEVLIPQDAEESGHWEENRRNTHEGSFRHFLSSLARGVHEQEYFVLFSLDGKHLKPDQLTIIPDTSLALKWFFSNQPLEVIYKGLSHAGEGKYFQEWGGHFPSSYIYLRKGYAQIDTMGNVFTKFAFIHSGYWYKERIANSLPFDYTVARFEKK